MGIRSINNLKVCRKVCRNEQWTAVGMWYLQDYFYMNTV